MSNITLKKIDETLKDIHARMVVTSSVSVKVPTGKALVAIENALHGLRTKTHPSDHDFLVTSELEQVQAAFKIESRLGRAAVKVPGRIAHMIEPYFDILESYERRAPSRSIMRPL